MNTLPPEIIRSLSEDGQRRYLNSLKHLPNVDQTKHLPIDNFSFQTSEDEEINTNEIKQTQTSKPDISDRISYSNSTTINSTALPILPLSTENSSAVQTPIKSLPYSKQKLYHQLKNNTLSEQDEQIHKSLVLEYYTSTGTNSNPNSRRHSLSEFPDIDFNHIQNNITNYRSLTDFTIDLTLKNNFSIISDAITETEPETSNWIDVSNIYGYLPEQSYEIITYEYCNHDLYTINETDSEVNIRGITTEFSNESVLKQEKQYEKMSRDIVMSLVNQTITDNEQNVCIKNESVFKQQNYNNKERMSCDIIMSIVNESVNISKQKKQTEIMVGDIINGMVSKCVIVSEMKKSEIISKNELVNKRTNKKKIRKTKRKKIVKKDEIKEDKIFRLSEKEKRLFIYNKPKTETNILETDLVEMHTDHFAEYNIVPEHPEDCIRIQRLGLLLSEYQSFTGNEKDKLIYKFICDGNIDENNTEYKYNEVLLLNDWYYTLIHYCENNELFERLYKYISREIGTKCDISTCKFGSRHYQQNITSHDTRHYYGFTEDKQQTRIRILNNIHCHILHSYDIGFKLTNTEKYYIENGDEHKEHIDPMEKHLVDIKMVRLKRILIPKKKELKKLIGLKRLKYNKFVTQMFEENHNRKISMLDIPILNDSNKRPTKIEINDNYQFGQKFYYWNYHKKAGWKWYVRPKWKDLKSEMIGNKLLGIDEWNMYYNEAKYMSQTFLCKSYKPLIEKYFGNYFYGIRSGDILSIYHILSVLIFTNDYQLQLILNKSYTKKDYKESDIALKQRHSYYAHWARLICETVEIFVNTLFYKPINSFYHGTNCCEHFNEIYSSLYAPTSMTKSLQVATCYSNDNGLLLEFLPNNNRYFQCNWISPWSNESEIILAESTKPLKFNTVINCSLSHNYTDYISAISVIQEMLSGNPPFEIDMDIDDENYANTKQDIEEEQFSQSIREAMTDLIDHQLKKDKHSRLPSIFGLYVDAVTIADYIYEAFNHFVKNSSYHIQFDLHLMNNDYKHLQHFFFTRGKDWIKFNVLCKLFINIKYLSILPLHGASECYALKLTRDRMLNLYNTLERFNLNRNNKLERITIEQPNTDDLKLKTVVKDFKPMFKQIGWKISAFGWKKYDTTNPQLIIVKDNNIKNKS